MKNKGFSKPFNDLMKKRLTPKEINDINNEIVNDILSLIIAYGKGNKMKLPKKYEKEEKRHDLKEEKEEKRHEKFHDKEESRLLKKVKDKKKKGK